MYSIKLVVQLISHVTHSLQQSDEHYRYYPAYSKFAISPEYNVRAIAIRYCNPMSSIAHYGFESA